MESNKDKINQIPIEEVLNKLGYCENIHYKKQGDNIRMKDDKGAISDGWIGSIRNNRLYCKSGVKAGRFEGDIIGIIKGALNVEVSEAIKWAEEAFNIEKVGYIPKHKDNGLEMQKKWNSLSSLDDTQIEYLKDRYIEYNEHLKEITRKEDSLIVSAIQTSNFTVKALQKRESKNVDKKWRYKIEKGPDGDGDGIFIYLPKPDKKVIFIVEGLTDFWTLAQHGVNVIGLVSALAGVQYLKEWHKEYELIYIPDNDESGDNSIQKLEDLGVKFGHYKIDEEGIEDLNDLWMYAKDSGVTPTDFMRMIYDDAERPKTNIELALEKAIRNRNVKSRKVGEKTYDWATGGVTPGTSTLINGAPGQGKTTIAMWLLFQMLKQGKKVIFFSLETNTGKMLAQILGYQFAKHWKKEIYPNIERYMKEYGMENLEGLELYDDIRTLEEMEIIIKEQTPDVVFIDYAQIVLGLKGEEKDRMSDFALKYQRMAIDNFVAVIALSQTPKGDMKIPVVQRSPLGAQGLLASSDTFINVGIHEGKHKIAFIKCKEGAEEARHTEHDSFWDKNTGAITIARDFGTMEGGMGL